MNEKIVKDVVHFSTNFISSQYELSEVCRLICEDKCLEIILKTTSEFNSAAVVHRMRDTLCLPESLNMATHSRIQNSENDDTQFRNCLSAGKIGPQVELLHFVASNRGEVLRAFLLAVEKEHRTLYTTFRREFDRALNTSPCSLFALDGALLQQTSSTLLKENLTEDERRLLICPTCGNVMDDPVLLTCLHSYCRNCVKSSCLKCGRNVEELTHERNLYVLYRIAAAATRICSDDGSHSNDRLPSGGGQDYRSTPVGLPICRVHRQCIRHWCSTCVAFRCDRYSAGICGTSNHTYSGICDVADGVREWISAFLEHVLEADGTNNGLACLPAQSNEKGFTDKYLHVLNKKKLCLDRATNSAFENAELSVVQHYQTFSEEAKGLLEQVRQAHLYVSSIRDADLFVYHQRKLVIQQLRLLFQRTGKGVQCRTLPQIDEVCNDQQSRNVKRLLIECLPDDYDYADITEELLGKISIAETDSSAHLFWDTECCIKKEKENLRSIAELESKVEDLNQDLTRTIEHLHQSRETVKFFQQQLDNKEKEIEELRKQMAGELTKSISDIENNLRTTRPYVTQHMTEGEVTHVVKQLRCECFFMESDEQNVMKTLGLINQADALIGIISKKGSLCQTAFLEILRTIGRQNLVDVIQSGQNPNE